MAVVPQVYQFSYSNDDFEDVSFVAHKNEGVVLAFAGDGVAEYHKPSKPRRYVQHRGEMVDAAQLVGRVVVENLLYAPPLESLKDVLIKVNRKVGEVLGEFDFPLDVAADLPGVDFAAVRVSPTERKVELVQGGDTLAVCHFGDSQFATPNQCAMIERGQMDLAARLKAKGITGGALWDSEEWETLFRANRARYTNQPGGYATLNGQPGMANQLFTKEFHLDAVGTILLFTDGVVNYEQTFDPDQLAATMIGQYVGNGWLGVVGAKGLSNIKEATGIAIEF